MKNNSLKMSNQPEGRVKKTFLSAYISIFGFLTITLFSLFCIVGIANAQPSIISWSSSGGNPTNKDNPQDLIYKVQQLSLIHI